MKSWRVSWRNLMRKKWRSVLTIVAIVIGVASTAAVVSTVQTTQQTLLNFTERAYGNFDVSVLSTEGVLPEVWIAKSAEVIGVSSSLGRLDSVFSLEAIHGTSPANVTQLKHEQSKVNIIGVHDLESDILDLEVTEGDLAQEGLVVDERTAALWGVRVGDEVVIGGHVKHEGGDGPSTRAHHDAAENRETHRVKVTAIVRDTPLLLNPDSWSSADGRSWQVLLPLGQLQAWTGHGDVVAEVQIRAQDDVSPNFVREQLDSELAVEDALFTQPAVADLNRVGTGFEELYGMLYVIGGVSLLISAFILYNTLYISTVERRNEFAVMKAFGYTPWQVKGYIFREVLLLALTGTVLGLALSVCLSIGATHMLFQSFTDRIEYDIQWLEALLIAFAAGIVIPLAATWIPVSQASRISVTDVIRSDGELSSRPKRYVRLTAGIVLLIPGLLINHTAAFWLLFLGLALLFPYLFQGVSRLLVPFNRLLFGREGRVAFRNIERHKTRTALTAAILSFGITLYVFMGSLTISLTEGTVNLIRQSLGGDVWVRFSEPISSGQIKKLQRIDGVEAAAAVDSNTVVWHSGDTLRTLSINSITKEQMEKFPLFTYDQEVQRELLDKLQQPRTVVLGNTAYKQWGGRVGDRIIFDTFKGEVPFKVVGVVETMKHGGYIGFAHDNTFERDIGVSERNEGLLLVNDDSRVQNVKRDLLQDAAFPVEAITTLPEAIETQTEQTDDLSNMLRAVVFIGMVVAGIGIMNTLLMNTMERVREIGAMRAVGMTRWQVLKIMLSEAFFIGGVAAVVGVVMGVVTMYLTTVQSADLWITLPFAVSWQAVLGGVVAALMISMLASLMPGGRAANVDISQALKYE